VPIYGLNVFCERACAVLQLGMNANIHSATDLLAGRTCTCILSAFIPLIAPVLAQPHGAETGPKWGTTGEVDKGFFHLHLSEVLSGRAGQRKKLKRSLGEGLQYHVDRSCGCGTHPALPRPGPIGFAAWSLWFWEDCWRTVEAKQGRDRMTNFASFQGK